MKILIWKKVKELTEGDVTLTKKNLWLIGICCFLGGIVYGLFKAPYTHGVRIGCNNGNNNGNGTLETNDEEEENIEK